MAVPDIVRDFPSTMGVVATVPDAAGWLARRCTGPYLGECVRARALLLPWLLAVVGCFDQAPVVDGGADGDAGSGGGTPSSSATASSADGTGDTAVTCDDAPCRAAPMGWNGPHLLIEPGGGCPPGTSEGQHVGRAPGQCSCSCDDRNCVAQGVRVHPMGCAGEPAPVPVPVTRDACATIMGSAVEVQPAAELGTCEGGVEVQLTWCEAAACDSGRCLVEGAGADTRFGACVWCEGEDAACPACPLEFPERVPLRQGPALACECCGAVAGSTVCNGIHDGCDGEGPALPVDSCVEVSGSLSYAPVPVVCMEPIDSAGISFIACCERDIPMP